MANGLTLVATGLSHKTASLSMREDVAVAADDIPEVLGYMGDMVGNGVILSTCNRTEVYYIARTAESSRSRAMELFRGATGASHPRIEQHTYYYRDEDAIRHIHRVAAGMDSMVLGEAEILRQLRTAINAAFEAGTLTAALDRLSHSALRAGRRIHSETFLGKHDRSVATAAMAMARGVLGDVSESKILVLGAGDAGAMTIRTMLREGASDIRIANRTYTRAANLANHTGTVAIHLRDVPRILDEIDLVVSAAASPLLTRDGLLAILPERGPRPIVLVDIGVPRTIDESVRDLPCVHLFDMDDLMSLCPASPEDREQDLANANAIIEDEVGRFLAWWRSFHAVPTIVALEDHVEEARRREVAKTLRRMPTFDEAQREALEALTKALIKKVLHHPVTRLKLHGDDDEYIAVGRELFGLETNGANPAHHLFTNGHSAPRPEAPVSRSRQTGGR